MRPLARAAGLVLLILFAATCTPSRYVLERPGLDCERAVHVARRTLVEMGYTITGMTQPKGGTSGFVTGTKRLPDGGTTNAAVSLKCSASGVEVRPIEDSLLPSFEFSRTFDYSFTSLVQRPDVETPRVESGVQVLVEVVDVYQARLDLGGEAVRPGNVLIRLTVRNGTDRAVAIDTKRLTLVMANGASAQALGGPELDAALAAGPGGERVRRELLEKLEVPPRKTSFGFLVYPAGAYREARIAVQDVETGESDGFVTAVQ